MSFLLQSLFFLQSESSIGYGNGCLSAKMVFLESVLKYLKRTGKIKFKCRNVDPEEEKIGEYFPYTNFSVYVF